MIDVSDNTPIPASMAAPGVEVADIKACGTCDCKHSDPTEMALCLALQSIEAAQAHLDAYACHTDEPVPGVVEAADLLESVRVTLHAAAAVQGGSGLSDWCRNGCLEAT